MMIKLFTKEYEFFNDMPPEEILKRIVLLPIVEPTEQSLFKGGAYIYSDNIDEFVHLVYEFGLIDESGSLGDYERNKLKKYGIDSLSIYDLLVLISNGIVHERYCVGAIKTHVESGCFKEWVLKLKELASQISKDEIYTKKGARIIYGLRNDIRKFKPLFNCKFTYAKTMPDIPHFYKVMYGEESEELSVAFYKFKYYIKYFGKEFTRKKEQCGIIECDNHYYRIHKNLIYRIPADLKTFNKDMEDADIDYYFGSLEDITKNRKKTVKKIKDGEVLIPKKIDRSGVIFDDGHFERNPKPKKEKIVEDKIGCILPKIEIKEEKHTEENKPPYDEFVSEDCDTDVAEEIRVFPDYIQYNTRCGPAWIDYSKLEYKIKGKKLYVKAFEYAYVDFYDNYDETDKFYLLKDGELNTNEFNKYIDWCINEGKKDVKKLKKKNPKVKYTEKDRKEDIERAMGPIDDAKKYSEWHEFRYIEGPDRYSTKAKKRIMKKIKDKDWDAN